MPSIHDVRIRKNPNNRDFYQVVRGRQVLTNTMSYRTASQVAGAARRVIIKHALREVGVRKMPRSLVRNTRRGL